MTLLAADIMDDKDELDFPGAAMLKIVCVYRRMSNGLALDVSNVKFKIADRS